MFNKLIPGKRYEVKNGNIIDESSDAIVTTKEQLRSQSYHRPDNKNEIDGDYYMPDIHLSSHEPPPYRKQSLSGDRISFIERGIKILFKEITAIKTRIGTIATLQSRITKLEQRINELNEK